MIEVNNIYAHDARTGVSLLPDASVQCIVTSPPYYRLRDYGMKGQIGIERTPEEYVQALVSFFQLLRPKLKDDGTLWLNLADTYCKKSLVSIRPRFPHKPKDLYGIPWTVALALKEDGWYLRQDIIWMKTNTTPESVKDRCTKAHEYIFLFSKSGQYYFNHSAIKEPLRESSVKRLQQNISKQTGSFRIPGKTNGPIKASGNIKDGANKRSVWQFASISHRENHPATFPPQLPKLCILAGTREGDLVLDPFAGIGTTLMEAQALNRKYIGFELQPAYVSIAKRRLKPTGS